MKEKRSSFSGSIGFVLAAAGSAVGVGNIWRFPYLCAKDGGGLFLLVYLVLVLTFGFVLLTTDVAIGRKTKKNALKAFEELNPKWKFLGRLTFLVPVLIMTYYSVIGGWITKYLFVYIVSDGTEAASDGYFTSFITSDIAPIVFMLIFLALTAWIVFRGVEKGIEKFSKIIMPGLILLIVVIAIFCLTLTNTAPDGTVRTGMQGLAVYLKPDFHGLTVKRFLGILLDAMSQLFFSLSVSMGIMITYGSYVKNDIDLNKATNQIEIFDTGVAILAGMMIIPAVYVFLGNDGMASGPSLIFISLPKVFDAIHLTSDKYPDRLGDRTGLDHRRSRTQRRKIQTCRYVPLYDPLCRSGRNARPVPCVYRIRIFDCIIYWILNVCGSGKKMLHFTFQYFQICSILQSCFCSDSVFLV